MNHKLIPVSIELLYDGMVVPQDIYDADGKLFLVRTGHTLKMSQVDAIKRYNKNRDTMLVTQETHELLMANKKLPPKSSFQSKLEKATGYTDIKSNTMTMLKEIVQTNTASRDKVQNISRDLSETVEKTKPAVILDLINTLAPIDEYLQRHCMNVSLLNGLIGKWLDLPKETIDKLILVGLVHDCGKIAIPPQVLHAPRKLTASEFEVIKMHTVFGFDTLSEFPDVIRKGVRGHHEKFAGKGYPDNLSGADIPLLARISAVSDIYDAMVSQRVYKDPRNPFHIISWIKKLRGTDLDEKIVDVFTEKMPREMVNKPAMLSNGEVGIIHELDYDDLEHPYIRIGEKIIKTDDELFCTQMYLEERGVNDG
jgi:HD-GYP domain-containing protein (c-di-GMP phosphodiesterase class II)